MLIQLWLTSLLLLSVLPLVLSQGATLCILCPSCISRLGLLCRAHTIFHTRHRRINGSRGHWWSGRCGGGGVIVETGNLLLSEKTFFLESDLATALMAVPEDEEKDFLLTLASAKHDRLHFQLTEQSQ